MEDIESLLSQKKEKNFFKEKELFLRLIKNKEDTLFHKKCHNKYMNDLKSTISDGLTILSETGFDSERHETKKKDLLNNNNNKLINSNKKNSKKILYTSGRNLNFLQNNIKSERSLLTSPNSNKKNRNYFSLRNAFLDKFFVLYNRNSPRIKSSYTHQNEIHKTNNFINSNYFTLNKESKVFPSFNKTNGFSLYPYNAKDKKIKSKNFSNPGSNYNSNKSLTSHNRKLSPKKPLKPFKTLSPEKEKKFISPINSIYSNNKLKLRAERKIKNIFNNTILKFNRNKLKFHSPKNIKKRIAKLSEAKVKNKNKNLMKEFYNVKTIVTDFMKKKKKTAIEFKNKSLSYKRIQNEKKIFFKKAFRQYFSPPNRDMKVELSNYIKNRYFIVDENNNPFKFRIYKYNHIF